MIAFWLFAQPGRADSGRLRLAGFVPATLGASLFAEGDHFALSNTGNETAYFEIGAVSEALTPGEGRTVARPAGSDEPIEIRVVAP